MHPCPYCTISKTSLSERGADRTIASIRELANKWKTDTKSKLSKSKDYCNLIFLTFDLHALIYYLISLVNCVNDPIIIGDENDPVMKYVPPPELHLMIGIVKHLFGYLEKEEPETAEQWMKRAMVQMDHQQQFNGNNARRLLKKIDVLHDLSPGLVTMFIDCVKTEAVKQCG